MTVFNFIIDTYLFMLILQMILESQKLTFHHNVILDSLAKYTRPVVKPFQKWLKKWGTIDLAFVVVILLLELIKLVVVTGIETGSFPNVAGCLVWSIGMIGKKVLNIYTFIVLIAGIASWVPQLGQHPLIESVRVLANPLLKRFKGLVPAIQGYDLTPVVTIVVLQLISLLIFGTIVGIGVDIVNRL